MSTNRRNVTHHDLLRFQMADDPRVSPDGRHVAWVRTGIIADENRYRSKIVVTDLASNDASTLVDGTHPRWSPDGSRIAYLAPDPNAAPLEGPPSAESFVDTMAQLWVMAATGGDATMLTSLRGGAAEPAWAPDGSSIVFTTLVHPERGLEEGPPASSDDPYERYNRDVLVVTRVRWKSDAIGLVGDYVRQLAVVSAGGGAARLLTRGTQGLAAPAWSPDGATIAAAGNLSPDADTQRRQAVYLVDPASDPAEPRDLFWLAEMRGTDLAWSPSGDRIAVCGHDDAPKGHYGFQKLWIVDVSTGAGECVTTDHDVSLGDYSRNQDMRRYGGQDGPRWLPDGRALLVLTNERGTVNVARCDLEDRSLTAVTKGDHSVCAFTLADDGRTLAYVVGDHVTPGDVWTMDIASGESTRLTDVNADLRAEVAFAEPERFVSTSSGVEVEGWVLLPPERQPGGRFPVILYTGGGPGGMRSSVFTHEWQVYAAQGYAVVNCNARGNYGYGESYSDATRGAWGDLDYQDNMAFLREVVDAYDVIDGERMAVAGGSYGGYMASWITARHTEFKASVVDRCLFNRYAFGGTSDIGMLLDHIEFGGKNPWEAPEEYLKWSPFSYVSGIRTPTLVVHSALDYRCPIDQGEQLYSALRLLGVPSELVRFPDENHELSRAGRPWHRIYRLERYLDWFERYL